MDLTQGTNQEKQSRSKKMMLWFGIGSLIMSFAGLISAFIVSSKQRINQDWLSDYELPDAFFVSVLIAVASSITITLTKRAAKKSNRGLTTIGLFSTFVLGAIFIVCQFIGFSQIIKTGYNFTGPTSNITMTYIYVITVAHIAHVIAGLIALLVVMVNHFKHKYTDKNLLGIELATYFWHFVGILWLLLFLFLYFFSALI